MNSQIAEIIKLNYVDKKKGQVYTAKQAGISVYTLKKYLHELNIPIRNHNQATILSNKNRTYKKNDSFFKTESSDMAWLLGFLASDGCVGNRRNTITINLSRKDREILEKIKTLLQIENDIVDWTTADGFDCSELRWTSTEQKEDLAKYSIIPRKTLILKPPYALSRKYWIDYIRGYFDGDGSVNLIKNSNGRGNGNLRWQVGSATKEIIEFILNFFEEEYNIPKVNIQVRPGANPFYTIQYSSVATKIIYQHLYTENALYLKRKKEHFKEIIAKIQSDKVI